MRWLRLAYNLYLEIKMQKEFWDSLSVRKTWRCTWMKVRLDSESLPRRPCCRNLDWDFELDSLDPQERLEENAYIQQSLVVGSWGTWSRDLGMFLMLEWSGWPICPFKGQGPYQPTFLPFRNPSKSWWDVPVEISLIFSLDIMNIYLRMYTLYET